MVMAAKRPFRQAVRAPEKRRKRLSGVNVSTLPPAFSLSSRLLLFLLLHLELRRKRTSIGTVIFKTAGRLFHQKCLAYSSRFKFLCYAIPIDPPPLDFISEPWSEETSGLQTVSKPYSVEWPLRRC